MDARATRQRPVGAVGSSGNGSAPGPLLTPWSPADF